MNRFHIVLISSILLVFSFSLFGPFSVQKKQSENRILFMWSGNLTSSSITIKARLLDQSKNVKLALSLDPAFDTLLYSSPVSTDNKEIVSITMKGLKPGKKYYYTLSADDELLRYENLSSFQLPADENYSFSFAVSSCALNSEHPVFTEIKKLKPLLYINTGDIHYGDPGSSDPDEHANALESGVLSATATKDLFSEVPIAYVWDDHDFCGNNSSALSPGKLAARKAYEQYVPHYKLPEGAAVYQSFTIGRIRFIMSDLRAERTENSIMAPTQFEWLKKEILDAKDANEMIAWISPVSWSGDDNENWGGFKKQRRELANFLRDNKIKNLFIICGDAHMLAIDNGYNSDFTTGTANPYQYPVLQASALNQKGTDKGGKYSEGKYPNENFKMGQFGLVTINDKPEQMCIEFKGYRVEGGTWTLNELLRYSFCRDLKYSADFYKIFPNPARSEVYIEAEGKTPVDNASIEIYDLQGKLHFSGEINFSEISRTDRIEIPHEMESGVYLINIREGNNLFRDKLLLVR